MSEIQLGKSCPECGGPSPGHYTGCSEIHRPPPASYDLAEFERQLRDKMNNTILGRQTPLTFGDVLECLDASKRKD